jgi:hypothetical protein
MAIDVTPYPEHHKFLSTPEADHLAELYLIQGDLKAAHNTLSLYFEKFAFAEGMKEGEFATISASLFRDGVILFSACFSTKDPDKLNPEAVFGHLDGWKEYCDKIRDLRDAFVAHNFGPQRQHRIVVIALEIGDEFVPAGFVQVFMRFAGWIAAEGKQLLHYVQIAREHLEKLIEEAEEPVLAIVANLISEELRALPDAQLKIPDPGDWRSTRERFHKSGRGEPQPLPRRRWVQTVEGELEPLRSDQQRDDPKG